MGAIYSGQESLSGRPLGRLDLQFPNCCTTNCISLYLAGRPSNLACVGSSLLLWILHCQDSLRSCGNHCLLFMLAFLQEKASSLLIHGVKLRFQRLMIQSLPSALCKKWNSTNACKSEVLDLTGDIKVWTCQHSPSPCDTGRAVWPNRNGVSEQSESLVFHMCRTVAGLWDASIQKLRTSVSELVSL